MSDVEAKRQAEALNRLFMQGLQALQAGQADAADRMLTDLLAKAPKHGGALNGLGLIAANRGDRKEAARFWKKAVQVAPEFAAPYINLGNMERQSAPVSAVSYYQKGIALAPDDAQAVFGLATLLESLERTTDAVKVANDGLTKFPGHPGLTAVAAKGLLEESRGQEALAMLDAIEVETLPPRVGQLIHYTKVAVLDRVDLPGEALVAAEAGASLLRQMFPGAFNAATVEQADMKSVAAAYRGRELPHDPTGKGNDLVFLIGFPNSGTERLANVLRHHPKIRMRDNTSAMENAIREAFGTPIIPQALSAEKADASRARYENSFGVAPDAGFVRIDNLSLNIANAGIAAELFPGAKFILCEREPAAACLASCMRSYEVSPASANLVSFDTAVSLYNDVMDSWAGVSQGLKDRTLNIGYMDLSRRPKEVLSELLEFIGLSGNAAAEAISALEFDQSPPLGDWHRYEPFLPAETLARLPS